MSKKKKPEQIQGKKYGARGLFNPLYSKGISASTLTVWLLISFAIEEPLEMIFLKDVAFVIVP